MTLYTRINQLFQLTITLFLLTFCLALPVYSQSDSQYYYESQLRQSTTNQVIIRVPNTSLTTPSSYSTYKPSDDTQKIIDSWIFFIVVICVWVGLAMGILICLITSLIMFLLKAKSWKVPLYIAGVALAILIIVYGLFSSGAVFRV
jgi:hypothetical protein